MKNNTQCIRQLFVNNYILNSKLLPNNLSILSMRVYKIQRFMFYAYFPML